MQFSVTFLLLFSLSLSAKLPSDFQVCKENANFNHCLKAAIEDALGKLESGIPDLTVPPLQPLNIPSVTIGEGTGAVNVVQNYKNFDIHGLPATKINKIESSITPNELKIKLEIYNTETRFDADYDFNGRVLLLPVVGSGKCRVSLKDVTTKIEIFADTFEKKGKTHLKVKDVTVELSPGKVEYDFQNLFNGDERLGRIMNKLLNDNWKDVFDDVRVGYNKVLETVYKDYANKIFSKVPYDKFF